MLQFYNNNVEIMFRRALKSFSSTLLMMISGERSEMYMSEHRHWTQSSTFLLSHQPHVRHLSNIQWEASIDNLTFV